ncbi:MAG: methyltransferase domain-containing protein [Lentisphaerae bacterium]|nr:methyltransferase domain-containing protein [Lentisphaerota bacterium]
MTKPTRRKMKSRELGLVLAQTLLDADDLHYGLWDDGLALSVANLRVAQRRYTDMVLEALPPPHGPAGPTRALDVGCGTGAMLMRMLDLGYEADGVAPDPMLREKVERRLASRADGRGRVFGCRFEDLARTAPGEVYDAALFSESFQYIGLDACFDVLEEILRPGGHAVICDFFRTAAEGDGGPGDGTFRGGKKLSDFQERLRSRPFAVERDTDITARVSPNIALVNDILMRRVAPAAGAVWAYLTSRHPLLCRLARGLFGRRYEEKVRRKYLSGLRSRETFERYKTYRLIVLRRNPLPAASPYHRVRA